MNPYDFVPIDFSKPPERREPVLHHKFDGKAGKIECRLTTETAIFIPANIPAQPKRFITRNGLPIIPGSSLKGLCRNLVETVVNGCFLLFDGSYEKHLVDYTGKLPKAFHKCTSNGSLCIACRMFGMLEHGEVFWGNVSISDAVTEPDSYSEHEPIYTAAMMGPKPRHETFYLDPSKKHIAGRKFYFHSPNHLYTHHSKTLYNEYIRPLNAGSVFTFAVGFTNLRDNELAALLYALVLEPTMRHKIGLAKPAGLGSVKIEIMKMTLIDYHQRYTMQAASELTGISCESYILKKIASFKNNETSDTLRALRRIWKWNPDDHTSYVYPDHAWFESHSQVPLSKTP